MAVMEQAHIEVELKFEVECEESLLTRLKAQGAQAQGVVDQEDEYFAHPSRNLRKTDETLRIRTAAGLSWLTYKGPKLSKRTKIREEVEIPLTTRLAGRPTSSFPAADDDLESHEPAELALRQILLRMGFSALAVVRKRRQVFAAQTSFAGNVWQLAIGLDRVDGIGSFVEIETVAARQHWREAEQAVWQYASLLGLQQPVKSSYLTLCLNQMDD